MVDSKTVNKEIKKVVHPLLRRNGFTIFTPRSSWRHTGSRVEVVNFQSFSAYNANILGCTTFSFSINLGIYFPFVPMDSFIKYKKDLPAPEEYQCHFRRQLRKTINQKELTQEEIWFVKSDGSNLSTVVEDARNVIERLAFNWFDHYSEDQNVLKTLLHDDPDMEETWGFGNNPSPKRSLLLACTAIHTGDSITAKTELAKVIESGCFVEMIGPIQAKLGLEP